MKKQKIWQHLPRDLLRCIYSEWLTWSDLSALDIACLSNEDRKEWLSSLSSIVKASDNQSAKFTFVLDHSDKLVNYYEWLGSHKVLVRDDFPMRLSVLEDLLRCCDPVTFCLALHSMVILDENEKPSASYDILRIESFLSRFLSHCSHLEEVRAYYSSSTGRQDNILYTALNNQIQDNKLVKINVRINIVDVVANKKIGSLLSKHVHSLKHVHVFDSTKDCSGSAYVLENLIKSKHALHVLNISIYRRVLTDPTPLLLRYLSTAGRSLKQLTLTGSVNAILTSDLLLLIGASCPNLEKLVWIVDAVDESVQVIEIYRLCPNFKYIVTHNYTMNEEKNRLNVFFLKKLIYARLEDTVECILLALQRGQYSQLELTTGLVDELELDNWNLVKSKIGSMLTSLKTKISEDALITILPNLPRLHELELYRAGVFTDRSLIAIAEYGQKLVKLCIAKTFHGLNTDYNDEKICEMIRSCNMLEELAISGAGCESILCAAQSLPRLRNVRFADVKVSMAEVVSLLYSEEVRWPCCLLVGEVEGDGFKFKYKTSSRSWIELYSLPKKQPNGS